MQSSPQRSARERAWSPVDALDPLLTAFLNAPRESAAERDTLRTLIDEVTPAIEGVLRGRLGAAVAPGEREELFSEAILQLLGRLQEIKSRPSSNPIANLSGYAAVTAFHVVHAHFRRAHPERQQTWPSEWIDETSSIESSLVHRSALVEVWREIALLPPRQRIALLLGLRDETGSPIASLLILLRIATFDDLAVAVELTSGQLAAIWDQLPLPDSAIAERLDLSRQQVINLRKSARERLARRLAVLAPDACGVRRHASAFQSRE
jgi:DNA-directed RNA polymerase specialized sigma24 family protein